MTFYVACPDCHTSVPVEERKEIATLRAQLEEARKEFREADSKQYQATTERNIALKERDTAIAERNQFQMDIAHWMNIVLELEAEAKRMRDGLVQLENEADYAVKEDRHPAVSSRFNGHGHLNADWVLEKVRAALSAPTKKPCNCGFDPGRCRTHNSTSTEKQGEGENG